MPLLNIIINRLNKFNLHQVLGYLGFFPFVFLIILVSIDKGNLDLYINLVAFYLFIIISFIGAVYWGITITLKKKNSKLIIFSVMPSITVSIIYILNIPIILKIFTGIFFLNSMYFFEKRYCANFLPNWYLKLRKNLNFFVTALILVIISIYLIY